MGASILCLVSFALVVLATPVMGSAYAHFLEALLALAFALVAGSRAYDFIQSRRAR